MEKKFDKKKYHLRYHGGGSYFDNIDLQRAKGFRDFGRGFYLSEHFSHAEKMAMRNSKYTGEGYVYEYLVPKTFPEGVNYKYFRVTSEDWLDFIMENRKHKNTIHPYDIVVGPTADASTVELITDYNNGKFGKVGSSEAKRKLLLELKTNVYPIQTCICTIKGLQYVERLSDMRVY